MIIKSIHLNNIRSYSDETIDLTEGITLFEGDIGSGKTTILMAIDFALFGNSTRDFYERLLRKGSEKGFVEIKFEDRGEDYVIYREIKKRGSSISNTESYVMTPDGKLTLTASEVKNYVLKLMGVDVTRSRRKTLPVVKYAIYTPQETMKEILEGSEDERLGVIRRIFKLDEYKVAGENAKKVSRVLNEDMAIASAKEEEVERLMNEYEIKQQNFVSLKKELEELENKKVKLSKEYNSKREEWIKIQNLRKKHELLKSAINSIEIKMESIRENINREVNELEDIGKMEKRLKELEKDALKYEEVEKERELLQKELDDIRKLEIKYRATMERIKIMEEKIKSLDEKKDELKRLTSSKVVLEEKISKLNSLEDEKNELEEKRSDIRSRIQVLNNNMEELKKELDEIGSMGAICPKCKRPLTEEHKKKLEMEIKENIESLRIKILDLSKEDVRIKRRSRELNDEISKLRDLNRELVRIEEKIRTVSHEIEEIENMKKAIEDEKRSLPEFDEAKMKDIVLRLDLIKKEIDRLRKVWEEYNKISRDVNRKHTIEQRIKSYKQSLKELEEELNRKSDELNELNYSEDKYESVNEEYKKIGEVLSALRGVIDEKNERVKELSREMDEKLKNIDTLKKDIEIFRKRGEFGEWLRNDFRAVLEDIEKMRLMSINEEFRNLFETWFYELLGESEYEATIDEAFTPIVRYQKFDMPLKSLSGGERTSIALAYRLALNVMVKRSLNLDTNILILDEPTDGFSKDQLYKLKDVFEKMETDQVIIVSHEKELMNLADRVYHIEKINGESKIKLI